MAATLTIRRLTLGDGIPKIIVPIVGKTTKDILLAAQAIAAHPHAALAEWRADHYEHALHTDKTCALLQSLRNVLQDKPLLYTFRTAREGGERAIEAAQYAALLSTVAASGYADLIDVEMFSPAADTSVREIHAHGVSIVGSWHDFAQTPGEGDLLSRFRTMQQKGADVLKIAVMPQCLEDVTHLINAAKAMHKEALKPLCAMSMGNTGCITRTHCQHFGSCMTFGTLGAASAPGQVDVDTLYATLRKGC